jgi:hypothetical protein
VGVAAPSDKDAASAYDHQLEDDIIRLLSTVEQAMVNTNEAFVVLFSAGVLQVHIGLTNPAVIVLSIACSIGLR